MKYREAKEILSTLLDDIAEHTEKRCDAEIRSWLMAAAIKIWSGNKLFDDEYVRALSVLSEEEVSAAQVITAMDCADEEHRKITIPSFYQEIVRADAENGTRNSREIIDSVGNFLVAMALINGDFTMEEANELRKICDTLSEYCDSLKIPEGKAIEYHSDKITPLKKTGYYQETHSGNGKDSGKRGKSDINCADGRYAGNPEPVTINLQIVSDENEDEKIDDTTGGVKISDPSAKGCGVPGKTEDTETLESVMAELNGLVGLDKVKEDVQSLMNFIKICQIRTDRGMKVPAMSYHLVFTGNPGTGKTTVARLIAKLYYLMGLLPQGQLVETDRSGLVAGYLGQTAIKTQKVIQEAMGGVLFIDEAYSLVNDKEDSYGKEAIETILKAMEDNRDELVVIVAGYDELMHQFIDSNPGLRSRFNKYFHFPDYNGSDLLLILKRMCENNGYVLSEDTVPFLQEKLDAMYENREAHFGNARAIRNLFEHAINYQANRLVLDDDITDQELAELTFDDILPAMEEM